MQDEMDNGSNSHLNDSAWEYKGAHNIRLELQKLPDAFTYLQQFATPPPTPMKVVYTGSWLNIPHVMDRNLMDFLKRRKPFL